MNEKITPMPDCSFCRDEGDVCCFCRAEAYPALTARVKELEEALRKYSPYVIGSGPSLDHDALTAAHRNAQAALNKEPT